MERTTLDRREFTTRSLLAMLSGVAITISGCGGGSDGGPSTPSGGGSGSKTGSITGNHGHSAVITSAELTAGAQLSLNIQSSADHNHTVQLTAAEVVSIRDGRQVAKMSSNTQAHDHTVTFN